MKSWLVNGVAFALRGASALAKLVFVIYLGAVSDQKTIGEYGLLVTLTVVFSQLAGLEIHQIVVREWHKLNATRRVSIIFKQATAVGAAYIVLLIVLGGMYNERLGGYWFAISFIFIADHYTTEVYRYLVANLKIIRATAVLALKNVSWIVSIILCHNLKIVDLTLHNIIIYWTIGVFLAIALGSQSLISGARCLNKKIIISAFFKSHKLVWASGYFILSAAAIAVIAAADKFAIDYSYSVEQLGRYYFAQSIASVPSIVVAFTVGLTVWPKCIKLRAENKIEEYEKVWLILLISYLLIISVVSVSLLLYVSFGNKLLHNNFDMSLFVLLMLAAGLFAMAEPFKLKFYLEGMDYQLTIANICHMIIVFVFLFIAIGENDIRAIAVSIMLSNIIALAYFVVKSPKIVK